MGKHFRQRQKHTATRDRALAAIVTRRAPPTQLPAATGTEARAVAEALSRAAEAITCAASDLDATMGAAQDAQDSARVTALDALYSALTAAATAVAPLRDRYHAWGFAHVASAMQHTQHTQHTSSTKGGGQ